MSKVLNTLLFRLKKSKILWVLLALTVAMALLDVGLLKLLPLIAGSGSDMVATLLGGDAFATTFSTLARTDSYSAMFVVFFVALFVGTDFSEGTLRNVLLSNKSRLQIYLAYLIVSVGCCIAFVFAQAAVYVVALALMGEFAKYTLVQALTGIFYSIGLGVLSCLVMAATTLLVLVGTKKRVLAVILPLAGTMVLATVFEVVVLVAQVQGMAVGALQWIPFAQQMFFNAGANNGALLGKILLVNGLLAAGEGVLGYFVFAKAQLK